MTTNSPSLFLLFPLFISITFSSFPKASPSSTPHSKTTLNRGSSLSVEDKDNTLTSPSGSFSCGFYQLGPNAFSFSIWFTHSANKTITWTANRDHPINGRGSRITFRNDGTMVLTDVDGAVVWATNTTSTDASKAELLNSGNLVITNSSGSVLWQSFDSPTDTLLPSQPITKQSKLVSSFANGALSSGYYSLYFDSDNVLILLYDGPEISSVYWPNQDLNVWQNGRTKYNSTRRAVLDDNGWFSSSDRLQFNASDAGPGIKRRLTMDYDGNLRLYSLNESDGSWKITWEALSQLCNVHGACGRNGVCVYDPTPKCSCPPFYKISDERDWNGGCKLGFDRFNYSVDKDRFVEVSGLTCNATEGDTSTAGSLYMTNGRKAIWVYFYGFVSAVGAIEFLFIASGWWFLFRKRDVPNEVEIEEGYQMITSQFRRFTYGELKKATRNFKEELGRGGSGAVYKGILNDKRVVAVKRLIDVTQGEDEFWAEVSTIGKINHMNLVRMYGFCSEDKHRLLVYEYLEKGSLDKLLFNWSGTGDTLLGWKQRLVKDKIASEDESWVGDLVDMRIMKGELNMKQAEMMVVIALLCVEEDSNRRPTMDAVVEHLVAND
ncbi:putative receptor protein kinase ZmPK1 [Acorus calamus]|uniref:non-specific serine/threonine protein kinase n=1 Tax=Acorus calamus TaxID=4465 RepID=A0AAV9CDR0_ACOCL|nr:putative receptor protein kinase ZmPK1 [Acorus calamus]